MASAHADFWEGRWERAETSWDIGRPYTPLARMIAAGEVPAGRALVPGCGRGHDVASLAAPDRFAVGLDFAPTAVAEARAHTAAAYPDKAPYVEFAAADFFTYEPAQPFDVVFDYTFLCAMPPTRRGEWAAKVKALLRPGGTLVCGEFPLKPYPPGLEGDLTRGPPFQLSSALYHDLLEPLGFVCVSQAPLPAEDSAPPRVGYEAVSVWRAPAA